MNKSVIFDWGGVILKEYPNHYCDRDAIVDTFRKFNNNLSREEAYNIYLDTYEDENGKKVSIYNDDNNKFKWYERVKKKANLNCTYSEFVYEFINNYKKIDKYEEVVNFIYSLKDRVNLYLFSDLIFVCYEALNKQIDLKVFDEVFLSYEEGFTKSDLSAFLNVNKKINNKDVLFIDNNSYNIENAKKIGWRVCLANGDELDNIIKAVDAFLGEEVK